MYSILLVFVGHIYTYTYAITIIIKLSYICIKKKLALSVKNLN